MNKKQPIRHDNLGIDTDIISKETDMNVLLGWKFIISEDIERITIQLNDSEFYKREHGEYSNYTWHRSASIKKVLFQKLLNQINSQLKTLRVSKDDTRNAIFYSVAKQELDDELFQKINDLVTLRLISL